ncbi:hypothetical protein P280DRAFT_117760 [Massarina eburnea CBS 473.64]|uniref:Uncharacterized protein n=1 Tax=Massarina eburnea CBS 473.64 TaxID=1395130 RepID=A0A6A6SC01_9PLEO|nr:hypothetical protein P280DRAFT_117760 [Massarina eburnea CBS 473.64]
MPMYRTIFYFECFIHSLSCLCTMFFFFVLSGHASCARRMVAVWKERTVYRGDGWSIDGVVGHDFTASRWRRQLQTRPFSIRLPPSLSRRNFSNDHAFLRYLRYPRKRIDEREQFFFQPGSRSEQRYEGFRFRKLYLVSKARWVLFYMCV